MIASRKYSKLGLLGPMDDLTAQIQGYVADFLADRPKLVEMQKSPILDISQKATDLLADQGVLEVQLQSTLALINKIQTDAYDFSDVTTAAAFVPSLVSHMSSVTDLWNEYQGLGSSAMPSTNWLIYGAIALAGYWFFIGRKK